MKSMANWIMAHRSQGLIDRLHPYLLSVTTLADIGSGTGHNAEELRRRLAITVDEFDVADLHWVGPGPAIISEDRLPATGDCFDAVLMLFVLQYPESPQVLLKECSRISRGPVIVLQSTYRGCWGRIVLSIRELFWGRLALRLALLTGILNVIEQPLNPRRYFTFDELIRLFDEAELVVVESNVAPWRGLCVSRDLFVLKPRIS